MRLSSPSHPAPRRALPLDVVPPMDLTGMKPLFAHVKRLAMPERFSGKGKYYAQYTSSFAWSTYERDILLLPYPSTFLILSQAWYSMSFLSAPSTTPSTPLKAGSSSKAQPQVGQVIELVSSDEDFRMSPPFPSFSVSHSLFHSAPTLSTPSRRSSRLASKVAKKVGRKGNEKKKKK